MRIFCVLLAIFIGEISCLRSEEIPVRQETLGKWHYLHLFEEDINSSTQLSPMAIGFGPSGSRAAVLLPGSNLVAEFKAGRFFDLHFPAGLGPCSLAADNRGRLYCLAQTLKTTPYNWTERWITCLAGAKWSRPVKAPFNLCDQIAFDDENRLWALGPAPIVAVDRDGTWDTFVYSDDKHLRFAPIRLASNSQGEPVLFSYWQPWEPSRMIGTLTYRAGQFIRDPHADTAAYIQAQEVKEPENATIPNDPAAGYVIEPFRGLHARTRLNWNGYTIVSLGTDGLAWTGPADAKTKPLSIDDEWQAVNHLLCPPTTDWPRGIMWVVRNAPSRFVKITVRKTEEFPINPEPKFSGGNVTVDVDAHGNPWLMSWHGAERGPVIVLEADQAKSYPDLGTALLAEGDTFSAGRIFPFAIKAPSGLVAFGGGYFDNLTVIEGGKVIAFDAAGIDPAEPQEIPRSGHGFNPFRGGEPWVDRQGLLHTTVVGGGFIYKDGKWSPSIETDAKDGAIPPLPEEGGAVVGPNESGVEPLAYSRTVFRGFHFYRKEKDGEKQLDFGLNPLATYPFSSGLVPAILDPQDRIWAGSRDINAHPNDATWYVERNNKSDSVR